MPCPIVSLMSLYIANAVETLFALGLTNEEVVGRILLGAYIQKSLLSR